MTTEVQAAAQLMWSLDDIVAFVDQFENVRAAGLTINESSALKTAWQASRGPDGSASVRAITTHLASDDQISDVRDVLNVEIELHDHITAHRIDPRILALTVQDEGAAAVTEIAFRATAADGARGSSSWHRQILDHNAGLLTVHHLLWVLTLRAPNDAPSANWWQLALQALRHSHCDPVLEKIPPSFTESGE